MDFLKPLALTLLILTSLSFSFSAEAKRFRNAYISFDLPEHWNCTMEGTEWVCFNDQQKPKEAVIILAAKEIGPSDTLENYENHLKSARQLNASQGGHQASQVVQVNRVNIDNHTWVDGLHIGSEVNSYYTRYLATTKDRIAILVTFSAHRNFYTRYSHDFIRAINSLRIVATQDILNQAGAGVRGPDERLGGSFGGMFLGDLDDYFGEESAPGGKGGGSALLWLGLGLILVATGFLLLKKQSPQKGKKKKSGRKSKPS